MSEYIGKLLLNKHYSREELISLLSVKAGEETDLILRKGLEVKAAHPGRIV